MIIPRGEDQFATVTFKPAASGKVREVLTASVEGGDIPLEFGAIFSAHSPIVLGLIGWPFCG
jgi:hypothetical protein